MSRRAPRFTRRLMLRGAAGVAFGLPFLESVASAQEVSRPIRRFVGLYLPNGVYTPKWFPTAGSDGKSFVLSDTHRSLEPLKEHVLWLGGLNAAVAVAGEGEQHQRGLGGLLTGEKLGVGNFLGNDGTRAGWADGASIDQMLVPTIGVGTRVPSLQLAANARERDVSGVLSYAGKAQPLLPENDPIRTYGTLFSTPSGSAAVLTGLRLKRASVLDAVLEQFAALRRRVSAPDRVRLDQHAQKVRELEQRLALTQTPETRACKTAAPPPGEYASDSAMGDAARLQLELLALAFVCDVTRVATMMFSDAKNHISMPFVNIHSDVHSISHYGDTEPSREQLALRDQWVIDRCAAFLQTLRESAEGSGTVLDNTLLLLGSDVARGNIHSHDDMPFLLAGHGAGFRMGRTINFRGLPHNNLLVSIVQSLGGSAEKVGNAEFCSGPLAGLT